MRIGPFVGMLLAVAPLPAIAADPDAGETSPGYRDNPVSDYVDRSSDGLSAVYSFFDPDRSDDSLGSYIVLRLIEEARRRALPYVYLGYWIAASRKMAYKIRFQPLEAFGADGWGPMDPPAEAT